MRDLTKQLENRILLLDGGFGTMIQTFHLTDDDFRGLRFKNHPVALQGCNDVLALTRPDVLKEIHERYLQAGSDIISTCTFNTNAFSLADYQLSEYVDDIAVAAATIAREVADRYTNNNPDKPRYVGGSIGPTSKTSSIAVNVEDPASREASFDDLADTYKTQIMGLVKGGVDLLILETCFDILNAKAALFAAEEVFKLIGHRLPVMVSGTLSDQSGRTLSGQTVEAFYTSISPYNPVSIGFNCGLGARQLMPYIERLAAIAETRISVYPNAGMPNLHCSYDQTPELFVADIEVYLQKGLVNMVGGCCGTTPEHIAAVSQVIDKYSPRPLPSPSHTMRLSGLEALTVSPDINFINIGERTNVAGSAKFARLIRDGQYDEALSVARAQVESGAQVIDVCMDAAMIDGPNAMHEFLLRMSADPEIIKVPVMIDSSNWDTLETGLKLLQGKAIVNSISLKEGEDAFIEKAMRIHQYGAAAVVMLFDENGQADTFERKIEVAQRAYRLLVSMGFPPEDIVIDPNILAVATGIEAHDQYGKAFIDATRWIKENLPFAKVSGGVSNLSFAFRGNNAVREAMHSVFLYHAIGAGMDMGIVNAQSLKLYSDIDPSLLEAVEDVILCRRDDATDNLITLASSIKNETSTAISNTDTWREQGLKERIAYALQHGILDHIDADILEACHGGMTSIQVIDELLMPAMEKVGQLFSEGKMFLPQVVKTARVMKAAVCTLTPFMQHSDEQHKSGKVVLATVKGDVHDIGKNIVSVVLSCNGYQVIDLGVMVEPHLIIDTAINENVDAICLSGLITPSLEEMNVVCREADRRGLSIPIVVGGATTSSIHTAVMMAPQYSGIVTHAANASNNAKIIADLTGPNKMVTYATISAEQERLRTEYTSKEKSRLLTLEEARRNGKKHQEFTIVMPKNYGIWYYQDTPIDAVEPFIDWSYFFASWGMPGRYPEIFSHPNKGVEARRVYEDAQKMLQYFKVHKTLELQAAVGVMRAYAHNDDLIIVTDDGNTLTLPMLRNQTEGDDNISVVDFVDNTNDAVACFALTSGVGLRDFITGLNRKGDEYNAIMAKFLADRLAEAYAEYIHRLVRNDIWGYEQDTMSNTSDIMRGNYRGARLAFGYPAVPDHSMKRDIFKLLDVEEHLSMRLTENAMITPEESICGIILQNAKLFQLGKIDIQQQQDYAKRRNVELEYVRQQLPNNCQ